MGFTHNEVLGALVESTLRPGEYFAQFYTEEDEPTIFLPLRRWKPVGRYECRVWNKTIFLDVVHECLQPPRIGNPEVLLRELSFMKAPTWEIEIRDGEYYLQYGGYDGYQMPGCCTARLTLVTSPL
ncbi:MAG: hypothetical protein ACYCQJ_12675 [Nitrososphaerales archaeon]